MQFKRTVYERFLTDTMAEEYPSQILNPNLVDFGPKSSRFEIQLLDQKPYSRRGKHPQVPQLVNDNGDLSYKLYPLKNRRIDPLVWFDGKQVRLSKIDKQYASLLR